MFEEGRLIKYFYYLFTVLFFLNAKGIAQGTDKVIAKAGEENLMRILQR